MSLFEHWFVWGSVHACVSHALVPGGCIYQPKVRLHIFHQSFISFNLLETVFGPFPLGPLRLNQPNFEAALSSLWWCGSGFSLKYVQIYMACLILLRDNWSPLHKQHMDPGQRWYGLSPDWPMSVHRSIPLSSGLCLWKQMDRNRSQNSSSSCRVNTDRHRAKTFAALDHKFQ